MPDRIVLLQVEISTVYTYGTFVCLFLFELLPLVLLDSSLGTRRSLPLRLKTTELMRGTDGEAGEEGVAGAEEGAVYVYK